MHQATDTDDAPAFLGSEMERRNCELSHSFGFCERDEIIAALFPINHAAATAKAAARHAAWNRDHGTRRTARITAERTAAARWAAREAAAMRAAGDHRTAALIESRACFFESVREADTRA